MKNNAYETSDYYLAVTLLSLGYAINNFDVTNPQRIVFVFEYASGLEETVSDFWKGKILLDPKVLFTYQKELKGRISQLVRQAMLTTEDIKSFRTLYQRRFGREISEEDAYSQASKLIQMMRIIHKPMSKAEFRKLQRRRKETDPSQ